jgi:hypothetical protein
MVAINPNNRILSADRDPVPPDDRLVERVRHYFDQHPEACHQPRGERGDV